jgi:plasmid stability protein
MSSRNVSRARAEMMWDEAAPVQVTRRRGELTTVLSVRLPRQILRELTLVARRHGKGPGTLARELIEQGLAAEGSASPVRIASVLVRLLESAAALEAPARWVPLEEPPLGIPAGQPIQPLSTSAPAGKPIKPLVIAGGAVR